MEDFVTVATYLSLADAEASRLVLEEAGIRTLATDESMGSLLGSVFVGGIKLQVAAADSEKAKGLLAALPTVPYSETDDDDDLDDDADEGDDLDGVSLKCPACKADVWYPNESRGTAEACPECGGPVEVPA